MSLPPALLRAARKPAVAPVAAGEVPIFVISLARAVQRRQSVLSHLEQIGARYRLVDAVDGATLAPEEWARVVDGDIPFHPGTVGCYLSHIGIYRTMVAQGIQVALILEDDARLHTSLVAVLAAGLASLDFDYCFLDSDDHNESGPIYFDRDDHVPLAPGLRAHRLSDGPQTTHAYLITLRGASKRLGAAFPIRQAIDLYDRLPLEFTFRAVVAPKLAWLSEHSLVSLTSHKADPASALRLAWLRKHPLFYRLRDGIRLKGLRRALQIRALVRQGRLAAGKRWAPLPSGREVVL